MIRLFAIYVNILLAVVLKFALQGDVGVTIEAPTEVVAGTDFEVKITVNKGDLESFSRLLQALPAGLTASSGVTSNADFNFQNKRARFIWLRMPEQDTFTVSYKVKVDQRLKGTFNISGKFSYLDDNERRSINVESEQITILPSPNIDPSLIVDIVDFERLVVPDLTPSDKDPLIACVRQNPQKASDGRGYIVNILVSKERKEKFAKIEESIPDGFIAENINDRDAIFTFKDKTAKFLWMNLPASSFFMVSYRLIPTTGPYSKQPELDGKFSYLEEDKTISIDITQTGEELAEIKTPDELSKLLTGLSTSVESSTYLAQNDSPNQFQQDNSNQEQNNTEIKNINVPNNTNNKVIKSNNKEPKSNLQYLLEPEEGIYYRVQLAAGHKPVNIKRYFRKYKLDMQVRKEMHNGWYKYSIGSFSEYKEARDYRVHIWNTTVIDDAFVSAYNDGSRITVQEALMIANQKWYK